MDEKYLTMAHYEKVHESVTRKPTHMCDGRTRRPTKRMLEELCERFNEGRSTNHGPKT